MTLRENTKTTPSWLPASLSLFVSGPSCAHQTHVFVAFRSEVMEHTASLAESQPAVKCVTTPSTTWSRGRWSPPMYRHCWNQIRCAVTMARAQMTWPYVLPWAKGRCLVWDFTCPDTSATSHLNRAVLGSGVVAKDAQSRKPTKYSSLSALYRFIPIAIETLGVLGDEALTFFHDLGQRIAVATAEPRSFQFLMQRLSVAIQRGNAACILGTVPSSAGWDELFYI